MKTMFKLLVLAFLTVAHSARSSGNNLVVNGGFELGIAGWQGTYGVMNAPDFAFQGSRVGVIDDLGSSSVGQCIHQTIATVPGDSYIFTFALLSGYGRVGEYPDPGNAPVDVYWGDQFIGTFSNPSTTVWQSLQFQLTADSAATTITFLDYYDMHWQLLDGVSVVAVPEPSPICIFGLAVCASTLGSRRFRYTFRRYFV